MPRFLWRWLSRRLTYWSYPRSFVPHWLWLKLNYWYWYATLKAVTVRHVNPDLTQQFEESKTLYQRLTKGEST